METRSHNTKQLQKMEQIRLCSERQSLNLRARRTTCNQYIRSPANSRHIHIEVHKQPIASDYLFPMISAISCLACS